MPNTFISLDVPRGEGIGVPAVVGLTEPKWSVGDRLLVDE